MKQEAHGIVQSKGKTGQVRISRDADGPDVGKTDAWIEQGFGDELGEREAHKLTVPAQIPDVAGVRQHPESAGSRSKRKWENRIDRSE